MKTPHTRGPWQLGNATSAGRFIGSSPDGVLGIAMAFGDTPDEQDANARLIAAAPDLLAVLREFCQDVQAGGPNLAEEWPDLQVTYEHAQAAIAKAEDRQ